MTEQEARRKAAACDVSRARREGEVLIARTVHGMVTLSYDRATGTYEIRRQLTLAEITSNISSAVIFSGERAATEAAVAMLYQVEVER